MTYDCVACDGTGWIAPGIFVDEPEKCGDCKGTGKQLGADPRDTDDAYEELVDEEMGCI